MFDNYSDQNQKSFSNSAPGSAGPINSGSNTFDAGPANNHPRTSALDDMFAGVDKGASIPPAMAKPAVFQPKAAADLPSGNMQDSWNYESKAKQYSIVAFGVVMLLLLAASGVWIFTKIFHSGQGTQGTSLNAGLPALNNNAPAGGNTAGNKNVPSDDIGNTDQAGDNNANNSSKIQADNSSADSDQDGLTDSEEAILGTDINAADTDNDGLFDRDEVKVYHTDPLKADTDGDGYSDGAEVKGGYNPLGAGKLFNINK